MSYRFFLSYARIDDRTEREVTAFFRSSEVLEDEDAVTYGAAIRFGESLDEGTFQLATITYLVEAAVGIAELEFCEAGDPPTSSTVVDSSLFVFIPDFVDADVILEVTEVTYEFTVSSLTVGFPSGTGEASFSVAVNIVEHEDSPGNPNDTFAFSMSLRHNSNLLDVTGVEADEILDDLSDSAGPEFFEASLLEEGFTLGVVYAFDDTDVVLDFEDSQQVVTVTYDTVADSLINERVPVDTRLHWDDALTDPPVDNTVVYTALGDIAWVIENDGLVTLVPGGELFLRGDCNANLGVDIGDAVRLLSFVFSDAATPPCEDACDGNDDGELTLADGLLVLFYLFTEGDSPDDPFPDCGADPTDDDLLTCAEEPDCS